MENQQNQLMKIQPNAYGLSLEQKATQSNGLAIVTATPSELAAITEKKVIQIKEKREKLLSEKDNLFRSWNFFANEYTGEKKQEHIDKILEMTREINAQIAELPEIVTLANDPAAEAIIAAAITSVIGFINVGKPMTVEQLKDTVPMIIEDFAHLTTYDIVACFNNGKKNHYGVTYDKLDGTVLLDWLAKYDIGVKGYFEAKNESRHLASKDGNAPRKSVELDQAVAEKMHAFKLQEFKQNPQ